jgi:NAD(P)-dependent dehydrogenase (short-subunit alcohol dehydrogenase family)
MDMGLDGKLVLITGGSKGIGLACGKAFAAEGARIALCSRTQENLKRAKEALLGASTFQADLIDAGAAAEMVAAVESRLGPVDVLVNSAGAARRTPPAELNPQAWRAGMDAKFFSYIHAIDPMVKRMAQRGRGVIVNIIGVGGKVAAPVHLPGGAANAALMLVTAGLGTAYAAKGVRVVGVNPGLTETDRVAERMLAEAKAAGISSEEARARSITHLPLGRLASPMEIAQAVVFLASPRASYITGTTLAMDGAVYPFVL